MVDIQNSKILGAKLEEYGIPYILDIGKTGRHGFGDGRGTSLEGWPERAIRFWESQWQ